MNTSEGLNLNTPVIIGAGEYVFRENSGEESYPSPADIAARAAQAAIADAGSDSVGEAIDTVAAIRLMGDSYWEPQHPCGTSNNIPRSIANRLHISPDSLIYADMGGHSPQCTLNEMAEKVFAGDAAVCLLTGGEAIGLQKQALRGKVTVDWNEEVDPEFEDRGMGITIASRREFANGLVSPPQIYALFENAWRAKHGLSREEHREVMGRLFSSFSEVAAQNPNALFGQFRSAKFLAAVSDDNYMLVDPYSKWFVAQDAVNMGAAVILTSVGKARELGVPEDRWVYLHGYSDIADKLVSARTDLTSSDAVALAGEVALCAAGKSIEQLEHFDLYSCFPCAVIQAAEALGVDWRNPGKPLTVTGGLPYFGGPGNNYSMHAIATMVQRLRNNRGDFGMVLANGGFLSKESMGIYSTEPPENWQPVTSVEAQERLNRQPDASGTENVDQPFTIDTYAIAYKRGVPSFANVVATGADGGRILAKVAKGDMETLQELVAIEPVGRSIAVTAGEKSNYFAFID